MNFKRLREKVLEEIYPDEEELEKTREKYREISEFIEHEFNQETHFAGSAGRETCMAGDKDIDIFVLFPEQLDKNDLEDKGLTIGKKVFKEFDGRYQIEYAEHPYIKGEIEGFEVEIVPCHKTDPDDIKSSVDRTPHHSRWVEENLDSEQRKDVVLLKKFLDSERIYGSSLKTRGFSGYLCEILIHQSGSFSELVENASEWGEKEVIDPENHHRGSLPSKLKKKFKDDILVVIDPVDPERNVASVLDSENYSKFIYRSWKFCEEPGRNFFDRASKNFTEFELNQEVQKRADFLVLKFDNPEGVDDIIYPQMRKTLRRLNQELRSNEFRVFGSGFHIGDKTRIFFELDRRLPEVMEVRGPKVFHGKDHLAQFNSKYENVFVRDERLEAKTERDYPDAKELMKDFLGKNLKEKGIPGHVAEKFENYSFVEPVQKDEKWLNYLGEKLNVS